MKQVFAILFVFVVSLISRLYGQNSDSLLIINNQLDKAYEYLAENQFERASKIGLQVLQYARKTNNPQLYAQSCLLLSEQSIRTNELENGVKYACRGMESVKEIDDFLWCNLGVSLCQLYHQYGVSDRAIGLAQKIFSRKKLLLDQELRLIDILTKSMISLGQSVQTENLLNNYFETHRADLYKNPTPYLILFETWVDAKSANGKHNEAYLNVINLLARIEQTDSKEKLFELNNKAGEICINLNDYSKAVTFFNEAVSLNKNSGSSQENYVLLNLARAYYFLGNYQRSFDIAEQSYLNAEKSNQSFQKAISAMFIARLKFAMNNTSSAIDWANTAFRLSQELGDLSIQYHVSILLSELFSINNEFDRSAKYKLKADQINEKILLSQQNDKLKRANLNIDIANAEFEAIMELQNFEKQRMVLNEKLEKIQVESERQEEKYRFDLRFANEVLEKERVLNRIQKLESEQLSQIQQFQISELENKRKSNLLSISELKIQKQEADNKNLNLKLKNDKLAAEDELNKKEIEYRKTQSLIGILFTVFVLIGLIVMAFFYRKTRSQNKIIELSSIEIQNINKELAEKNNEIVAGIEYASKFQEMVYPKEDDLKSFFKNAFIVHRPLEMVSGDLPFVFHVGEEVFVAAVDCIGHGVSASMLSIMTYYGLTDIIRNDPKQSSADILRQLHQRLVTRLSKSENRNYIVSVDLALLKINQISNELQFSGANLPLIILSNGQAEMIKGTHLSIGENVSAERLKFDNFNYQCQPGDELFLFSDGFYHQFGGAEGKQKLSKKRILVGLDDNKSSSFVERKDQFVALFDDWRGEIPQTDDLVIIGVQV